MNEFLDTLSQIRDFFNSVWFPAAVAVVGIVFFVVMFVKANRTVDKHRKEVRQKIVNDAYAEHIRQKYPARHKDNQEETTPSQKKS